MKLSEKMKNVKGAGFRHPLFVGVFKPLSPEDTPALLERLRQGEGHDEAVLGYGMLGMQIVGRYITLLRSERLVDDLVSAAMLGIVDAVSRVSKNGLEHDNLTGYVALHIHRSISELLESQSVVALPRRRNHRRNHKGEGLSLSRVDFNDPRIVRRTLRNDGIPDVEIKELLDRSIQNDDERRILELRQEGRSDGEIGEILGLSRTAVFVIRKGVETRFLESYYGHE